MLTVTHLNGFGCQEVVAAPLAPATWNPADKDADVTLSGGDLTALSSAVPHNAVRAARALGGGKTYFEYRIDALPEKIICGVGKLTASLNNYVGSSDGYGMQNVVGQACVLYPGGTGGYPVSAAGAVVNVAVDMGAGKMWFGVNGAWVGGGDPAAGTAPSFSGLSGTFYPMASLGLNDLITARFVAGAWTYAAPSGFAAI